MLYQLDSYYKSLFKNKYIYFSFKNYLKNKIYYLLCFFCFFIRKNFKKNNVQYYILNSFKSYITAKFLKLKILKYLSG